MKKLKFLNIKNYKIFFVMIIFFLSFETYAVDIESSYGAVLDGYYLCISYKPILFFLPSQKLELYNNKYFISNELIYTSNFNIQFIMSVGSTNPKNFLILGGGLGYFLSTYSNNHFFGNIPIMNNSEQITVPVNYDVNFDLNSFSFNGYAGFKFNGNFGILAGLDVIDSKYNELIYSLNINTDKLIADKNISVIDKEALLNTISIKEFGIASYSLGLSYDLYLGCNSLKSLGNEHIINIEDSGHIFTIALLYNISNLDYEDPQNSTFIHGCNLSLIYKFPIFHYTHY